VPRSKVTGLGSAVFAFLAAGTFKTIEEAQRICPAHTVFAPEPKHQATYDELYALYRRVYFGFGTSSQTSTYGDVLPTLIKISRA